MQTTYDAMGVPGFDNGTVMDYGGSTLVCPSIDAPGTSVVYVQPDPGAEMWLKCSCRAELKLMNYVIPDALNYAKE